MNTGIIQQEVARLRACQAAQLEAFLGMPSVVAAFVSPTGVAARFLTLTDAQRAYVMSGRGPFASQAPGADKRAAALLKEAMVRTYPGLSASYLVIGDGGFANPKGLWTAPSVLASDSSAGIHPALDLQFELTPPESRELAEHLRWLGSVRPAMDSLYGREVGVPPVKVVAPPKTRRLRLVGSTSEMAEAARATVQEANESVWLTASTIPSKGFSTELAKLAKERKLKIRCIISDAVAARELARAQPDWEVLVCPRMEANTLLIDANAAPSAFIGSVNWMKRADDKQLALALPLMIDDPRIPQIQNIWDVFSPLCDRA